MIRGYAGGTFDLLHVGHVNFLRACRRRCTHLTVAVNSDTFAGDYKRDPVIPQAERMEILKELRSVGAVVPNIGGKDSRPSILAARADVVFHGDDWPREALLEQLGLNDQWLEKNQVRLEYIPYTAGISTSQIIEACQQSR